MSGAESGPSSFEISNQMEMGRASNPRASQGMTGGGGDGMMPYSGSLELPTASIDGVAQTSNMDSMFAALAQEGGAFGKTITSDIEAVVDHHGVGHAKGEQGLKLESMGQGERAAPTTVQGDLQMGPLSARGSSAGGRE